MVSNATAGQQVLFTVTNFSKGRSLFRNGMTPVIRSTSKPAWVRLPPSNVYYYKVEGNYVLSFAVTLDK